MGFTGNEDHSITLAEASRLTKNYRESASPEAIKGGFFGKSTLQSILDQEGCVGIRFYYGQEEDGTPQIVLVGADKNENDLIEGILAQREVPCPPYCGVANTLNS